eukprot:jgi/Hompol1/856/HPOL_004339-RA
MQEALMQVEAVVTSLPRPHYRRVPSEASIDAVKLRRSRASRAICTKRTAWRFVAAPLVLLALIALLGYLFYPRTPTFSVTGFGPVNGISTLRFDHSSGLTDLDHVLLTLNVLANITTTNPNRFHIRIDTLRVEAVLVADSAQIASGPTIPMSLGISSTDPRYNTPLVITPQTLNYYIGIGNTTNVYLPAQATTDFSVIFALQYSPRPSTGLLGDPAFAELLQGCGVSSPKRKMLIKYETTVAISLLQSFGFVPTFDSEMYIDCPFTDAQMSQIIQRIKSDMG